MSAVEELVLTEQQKIENWRLHNLVEVGYPVWLAEKIAYSDADLHLAVDLPKRGCAYETAAEIVL